MSVNRRILLAVLAPVVFVACFFIAWAVLPPVSRCYSIAMVTCAAAFRSTGVDVFGRHQFTLAQTVMMMVGTAASVFLIAFALGPRHFLTSVGVGLFAVALVVAVTLPAEVTGPVPTKACSSPGIDGLVPGRCVIGEAPTNDLLGTKVLLVVGGVGTITLGMLVDRRRRRRSSGDDPNLPTAVLPLDS